MLGMCCFIVHYYTEHEVCFLNWMPTASLPDKLYPFHFPYGCSGTKAVVKQSYTTEHN